MAKGWPDPEDRQKILDWWVKKGRDPIEIDSYLEAFRTKCGGGENVYRNWGRAFLDHVRNGWLESRLEHTRGPGGKRYTGTLADSELDASILAIHQEQHDPEAPVLNCPHCEEAHGGPISSP